MLEQYWGLSESPFTESLHPRRFLPTALHEEALARLQFLIESRRGAGVLLGPSGTGKSLLLHVLGQQVARSRRTAVSLALFNQDSHELLWNLASGFGLAPSRDAGNIELWTLLDDYLRGASAAGAHVVVLVDNVQNADRRGLQVIDRLRSLADATSSVVTTLFAGRELSFEASRYVAERCHLRVFLPRLETQQAADFLDAVMQQAGRTDGPFDADARQRIADAAQGTPREILKLAELCLLGAMAEGQTQITAELVDAVTQEFLGEESPLAAAGGVYR